MSSDETAVTVPGDMLLSDPLGELVNELNLPKRDAIGARMVWRLEEGFAIDISDQECEKSPTVTLLIKLFPAKFRRQKRLVEAITKP